MLSRLVFVVMTASLALPPPLKAEEAKAGQPYSAKAGDKQVTSQKRDPTRGIRPTRQEVLKAARESVPMTVIQEGPTTENNSR
jgi:hypothetical protein